VFEKINENFLEKALLLERENEPKVSDWRRPLL